MTLKGISFGILSPKMIKEMSAMKIEQAELYDPDGFPIEGGISDLRLGVVSPGVRCKTCGNSVGSCLGHFGHLELTKPVINPLYGKKIYIILRSICWKCSRILARDEDLQQTRSPLVDLSKKKINKCPHCGTKQKELSFSKPTTFREGANTELSPEQVRQRLENITDEDVTTLKIKGGRPEWLIITLLPVPPVTVRPSITLETGERSEDDLTHKLVDIIRINERLKKNLELGAPDFIIADIWELLQYHVSTYMDNEISTLPPARHRSGRSLRTLVQRLGKKDGRFRGNLSGKRVNFSARTVISPDPRISLNEVGIPQEIAQELTVPVRVNKNNKAHLKKIVEAGSTKYPGANYVIRPDGVRKKITEENKKEIESEIDEGYLIERHLVDGDIVLFNRQPSLHRMSMMAHRAKIMPYRTMRLNITVTTPYNADFDGDEMNLHVPQSEESQVEAEMLMLVENHIRSPRYGYPIICGKQDHITGSYLLTRSGTRLDRKTAAMLLMDIGMEDKIEEVGDTISGKELFSFILPKGLNISYRSSFASCKCDPEECTHDGWVVIKNGRLMKGVIDENSLGEMNGKLINVIEHMGTETARDFIDKMARLSLAYLYKHGFSLSVSDQDLSTRAQNKIREIIEECEKKADAMIKKLQEGRIKPLPGLTPREVLEGDLQRLTNETSKMAAEIVKADLPLNNAVVMARTGARGSYVNLTQMCGFVGQESLEGERINRGFTNRTLSHFEEGEIALKARGFVDHSYKEGLDPFDFFFDAMNSRENLMDKSLHTRHSGYMERRLVNALQDLHVEYDLTVRDSHNFIVQFVAGEDGIDPSKSDGGGIPLVLLDSE
ncbi:MAG: DNA-directed RNA polymerase subunit A' [Candidatus Aenigmarchaeota archaeon]|nr:DNA-directed RNA polymerase subunit A' [Candidatus Aenigmarchaeota archaeon]